ncbi:MAG: aminotransferase class IV [Candidatus Poseidoniaceae archaeon]|jgi:branched-subunit amino acid aminotransferase/4-amino-4-deoxychorismate lyase|nr:aminotransferase class IV [Candidatus Poseidoniaceae archaeon]
MVGPKSAVFTTVRARNGVVYHLENHLNRLKRHAITLGIKLPEISLPENLHGLVKIKIENNNVTFETKPFYQEIHMDAEGVSFKAPRWTRKITGTKHGDWEPYKQITNQVFEAGADVGLLIHEHCIIDGDRVMPIVLDEDGVVWISDSKLGGVESVTFEICKPEIEKSGFIISEGRLNERLVARAKEIVLLGTGMGAARLTVLDDVEIGDDSNTLQQICIMALGSGWK